MQLQAGQGGGESRQVQRLSLGSIGRQALLARRLCQLLVAQGAVQAGRIQSGAIDAQAAQLVQRQGPQARPAHIVGIQQSDSSQVLQACGGHRWTAHSGRKRA